MFKSECPGSKDIREPSPEEITCRNCGQPIEIWSDETEAKCDSCGTINDRLVDPGCLNWCAFAKECVGEDKYKKIKEGANSKN